MRVNIKQVSGEGFLSFREPFTFDIKSLEGQTVQIDGKNFDDKLSESNGAGKSALLEAITWGLYGKICRKGKYAEEVISKKGKECKISVELSIGEVQYSIHRTRSKNDSSLKLFKNNKEELKGSIQKVVQERIELILGLDFTSFSCSTVFGQDFVSFPDLKPSERSDMLVKIRNLTRYTRASKKSAEKANKSLDLFRRQKEVLAKIEGEVIAYKKQDFSLQIKDWKAKKKNNLLELQDNLKEILTEKKLFIQKTKKELSEKKKDLSLYEKEKEGFRDKINAAKSLRESIFSLEKEIDKKSREEKEEIQRQIETLTNTYQELNYEQKTNRSERHRLNNEIKSFQELVGTCPTCGQEVDESHFDEEIKTLQKKIKTLLSNSEEIVQDMEKVFKRKEKEKSLLEEIEPDPKMTEQLETKKRRLSSTQGIEDEYEEVLEQISEITVSVSTLEKELRSPFMDRDISMAEKEISRLKAEENPFIELEEKRKSDLKQSQKEEKKKKEQIEEINAQTSQFLFWKEGFKKIQFSLFDQMVDSLENSTQSILSSFSSQLQVYFETERETKSGTIKDEFHIVVEDGEGVISYEMYSGGEKGKVRLAVQQALSEMIFNQCGRDFNFLAFDEPNNGLDEIGKTSNFEMFSKQAEKGKAILVTDHDAYFSDKFDTSIVVVKEGGVSRIE